MIKNKFKIFFNESSYLLLALSITLSGCGIKSWLIEKEVIYDPTPIQDVGAMHIAVLSVSPFDKYREAVQPQFKLSADDALLQVLPSTSASEERIMDLLTFNLQAAAKMSLGIEGNKESSSTNSETVDKTATSLPVGASATLKDIVLGQNPLLKYWTAVALYQEVQLLNRYVQDAAISEKYKAFVIRLQVVLLPWARNEPYDAYADISFFPNTPKEISNFDIRVLPLLVTDDVEAAIVSRSTDRVRQLALALSAGVKNVDIGSKIDSLYEKLESISGRDYNSAFTVARVTQNTLRARFGALHQGKGRYAMIPQTHNVTLLLMVPKDITDTSETEVKLISRTTILNAKTGFELKDQSKQRTNDDLDDIFERRGFDKNQIKEKSRNDLQNLIEENEYFKFANKVKDFNKEVDAKKLWVDLAQEIDMARYQTAVFSLPKDAAKDFADTKQNILLFDDEKTIVSGTIVGFKGFNSKSFKILFMAPLRSIDKNGNVMESACDNLNQELNSQSGCDEILLAADSIKAALIEDQFIATFPSLSAIKREPVRNAVKLRIFRDDSPQEYKEYKGYYTVKKSPLPFDIAIRERVIISDQKGEGKLIVNITKAPKNGMVFNLGGAGIDIKNVSADPPDSLAGPEKNKGILKLNKEALVTIPLFNLSPESYVTVYGTEESGQASTPITLRVVSLSGSGKAKD